MNGKANIGLLFEIIARRLDPPPKDRCAYCGEEAVEVLCFFHVNILDYGVCQQHLDEHMAEKLLIF